jgi:Uma2 family endonuclease
MGFVINAPETLIPAARVVMQLEDNAVLSDEQFFAFCQMNQTLSIERTATGEIIIMPPAGGETGSRNSEMNYALRSWARDDDRGVAFDSSTGFILPNGATRSPDAAWVRRERLINLTPEQKRKFLPLCPDFVVELQSPSDTLADLQDKMQEYIDNGAQLGWLLVPDSREVYIYRPHREPEHLTDPPQVSGEPLLPGFVLTLADVWDPGF